VTAVDDDASAGDRASLGQDCVTLQYDVREAQIYPAVPEPSIQDHWTRALSLLAQAASDCSDGSTGSDSALIAKSVKELDSGSTELDVVTNRVSELGGN
jgi:hypothetical protein